jgi:hypothetical protein
VAAGEHIIPNIMSASELLMDAAEVAGVLSFAFQLLQKKTT